MKKGVRFVKSWLAGSLIWGIVMIPALSLAESYAPLADFSQVRADAQCQLATTHEAFLKAWTPRRHDLLVPAYPNSLLTSAMSRGKAQAHGQFYQTLPSATLLTRDTPDQVVEFYQQQLGDGWHRAKALDIIYFYQMPEPAVSGLALMQQLMATPGAFPHIAIDAHITPCDQRLVPEATTRITVVSLPQS